MTLTGFHEPSHLREKSIQPTESGRLQLTGNKVVRLSGPQLTILEDLNLSNNHLNLKVDSSPSESQMRPLASANPLVQAVRPPEQKSAHPQQWSDS